MANVGKWELGEHLGSGVTGEVYLAKSEGQTAVLKRPEIATPQPLLIEQQSNEIRREADTMASLALRIDRASDVLVKVTMPHVLDKGEATAGGLTYFYLVMEAAQGTAVEKLLREYAPGFMSQLTFLRIVTGFARILLRTRDLGYLYSDVKPDHLYWDGRRRLLTVIDWGNCRTIDAWEKYPRTFKSDWQDYQNLVRDMLTRKDTGHFSANVRQSLDTLIDANVPAEIGVQTLESLLEELQRMEDGQIEEMNKLRGKPLTRENLNAIKSVADMLCRTDTDVNLPDTFELYWGELKRLYEVGETLTLFYQLLRDIQKQFPDREPERVQFLNDLLEVALGLKKRRDIEWAREGAKKVIGLALEGKTEVIVKEFLANRLHGLPDGVVGWPTGWLGDRQPTLFQQVVKAQSTFVKVVTYFRSITSQVPTSYFKSRLEAAETTLGIVEEVIEKWGETSYLEADLYAPLKNAFDFIRELNDYVDGDLIVQQCKPIIPIGKQIARMHLLTVQLHNALERRRLDEAKKCLEELRLFDPERDWDGIEQEIDNLRPKQNGSGLVVSETSVWVPVSSDLQVPSSCLLTSGVDNLLRDFNEALKVGKYRTALEWVTELEQKRAIPQAGRRELVTCFELLGKASTEFKTSSNHLSGGIGDEEYRAQKGLLREALYIANEHLGSLEQLAKFSSSRVFSKEPPNFNYQDFKDYAGTHWVWRALELWETFKRLAHHVRAHYWAMAAKMITDIPELSELRDIFMQLSEGAEEMLPRTPPYWNEAHIDKVAERLQAILEAFSRVEQTRDSNALSRWLVGAAELKAFRQQLSSRLDELRSVKTEWLTLNRPLKNQDSTQLWNRAQKVLTVVSQFTTSLFSKNASEDILKSWQSQFKDARSQSVDERQERLGKTISNHPLSGFLMWAPPLRSDWDEFWVWLSEMLGWLTVKALATWLVLMFLCLVGVGLLIVSPQQSIKPTSVFVLPPAEVFSATSSTPTSTPSISTRLPPPSASLTSTLAVTSSIDLTKPISLSSSDYVHDGKLNNSTDLYYTRGAAGTYTYYYRTSAKETYFDLTQIVRDHDLHVSLMSVKYVEACVSPLVMERGAKYGLSYALSNASDSQWSGLLLTDWGTGTARPVVEIVLLRGLPYQIDLQPPSDCLKMKIEFSPTELTFSVRDKSIYRVPISNDQLSRVGLVSKNAEGTGQLNLEVKSLTILFNP